MFVTSTEDEVRHSDWNGRYLSNYVVFGSIINL